MQFRFKSKSMKYHSSQQTLIFWKYKYKIASEGTHLVNAYPNIDICVDDPIATPNEMSCDETQLLKLNSKKLKK